MASNTSQCSMSHPGGGLLPAGLYQNGGQSQGSTKRPRSSLGSGIYGLGMVGYNKVEYKQLQSIFFISSESFYWLSLAQCEFRNDQNQDFETKSTVETTRIKPFFRSMDPLYPPGLDENGAVDKLYTAVISFNARYKIWIREVQDFSLAWRKEKPMPNSVLSW